MPPAIPIICGLLPDSLKSQYLVTQKKILMNFCFGFPHFLVREHRTRIKTQINLTLRYMGGGHNGHPQGRDLRFDSEKGCPES